MTPWWGTEKLEEHSMFKNKAEYKRFRINFDFMLNSKVCCSEPVRLYETSYHPKSLIFRFWSNFVHPYFRLITGSCVVYEPLDRYVGRHVDRHIDNIATLQLESEVEVFPQFESAVLQSTGTIHPGKKFFGLMFSSFTNAAKMI